eukprot:10550813-Karenia_brevis.AAC.1
MSVKERMQIKTAKALFALQFNHFSPQAQQCVDKSTHRFSTIDGERIQRMLRVAKAFGDEGPAVT